VSEPQPVRGFILQPTYRIERGRPVVQLYGRLESGEPFLVRDGREVPHFFVRAADAETARGLGAAPLTAGGQVTMAGEPVVRVEVPTPPDTPPLRDRLIAAGVPCLEADVRFAMRYLIDRGIRGALAIRGESRPVPGVGRLFEAPELAPARWTPALSVLSFDIETDPRAHRLLSIALYGAGVAEVLLFTPEGWTCPPEAVAVASQHEMLDLFCRRVREIDPDVLTGWNVADFDLTVLARLAERLGVGLELGRGPGALRLRPDRGARGSTLASVPGRLVMDGIDLLRGAFVRLDDYSLDAAAREILGEGKLVAGHGRAEEILRMFKEERSRLVDYNLTDARLVMEILDRVQLVALAVERSLLTGMPPDRVAASIASFDFLYLAELHRRGVVAPTVSGGEPALATGGGHVLEPRPGLYENVVVLDFKSLYPSLIRTFQIDPLGYLPQPGPGDDAIVAPNGAAFRRQPGILTRLLDELFPRREAAKRAGDKVASHAIKILMNSFYGVLGTPACRFHNPMVANAITSFGREVLLWSKARLERWGYRVLYGDTDSLFVASGESDPGAARELGEELAARLNRELATHLEATWRVPSRLEVEFERLYLRLHLLSVRHGKAGARKRYAGLVAGDEGPQVVFTGMESVRRDWTDLAKEVQRELYERLFSDREVTEYLRRTVAELRAGRLDHLLTYRKALRKAPEAYTSTTPPHVAAARRMASPPRRGVVAYLMTTGGAEPAAEAESPPDYEHYVDKQVRPVAEPVLALLGLDFATVIGDEHQLALF
jgi:DNA polymerase II